MLLSPLQFAVCPVDRPNPIGLRILPLSKASRLKPFDPRGLRIFLEVKFVVQLLAARLLGDDRNLQRLAGRARAKPPSWRPTIWIILRDRRAGLPSRRDQPVTWSPRFIVLGRLARLISLLLQLPPFRLPLPAPQPQPLRLP